jgi:uncharacterized protein (DUF433 family)
MEREISLVDRGRGPQLSTSRITVYDLVPYFQEGCSYDEILRWLPSLLHDEIAIVDRNYHQHSDKLDEYERRVKAHRVEQVQSQRLRCPEQEPGRHERVAQVRDLLQQRRRASNGEGPHR